MLSTLQRSPNYSEAAYFDGDHCHHCATRDEFRRLQRIEREGARNDRAAPRGSRVALVSAR